MSILVWTRYFTLRHYLWKSIILQNLWKIYNSIADNGLYLIIFESNIHRIDVVVTKTTPPQPSSKDHEVENSRAERRGRAGARAPSTPSAVSSTWELPRVETRWILLKWIIISVNIAKSPGKETVNEWISIRITSIYIYVSTSKQFGEVVSSHILKIPDYL